MALMVTDTYDDRNATIFRAGMKQLEKLGLVLDAWLFHPQLGDAVDLARAFPNASIVMCHMGGPLGYGPYTGKQDEVFAHWKASITELAKCPNVAVKLGGEDVRPPQAERQSPSDLLSAELDRFTRDRVYEEAALAAVA